MPAVVSQALAAAYLKEYRAAANGEPDCLDLILRALAAIDTETDVLEMLVARAEGAVIR